MQNNMNRYDTISTSAYAPRSLPRNIIGSIMEAREKHDAADKKLTNSIIR
jgi:hypothetical protein